MVELARCRIDQVLGELASRHEPPAAGVGTALTAMIAASLVELAAGLTARRLTAQNDGSAHAAESQRSIALAAAGLRGRLLTIADDDVRAYAAISEAGDEAARARALDQAAEPPLAIAESATEVAELAAKTAQAGSWAFTADAVAAAMLAAAAATAAAELVSTNLVKEPRDPRITRAATAADRARRAGDRASGASTTDP